MSETNATNLLIKTNTARIVALEEDVKMITKDMATESFVSGEIEKIVTKLDEQHASNGGKKFKILGVALPIPIITIAAAVVGAEVGYAGIKNIFGFLLKIITSP